MTQSSLWQHNKHSNDFAEVCNALYERELHLIANADIATSKGVQGRLKGLSYYVNKTANLMTRVNEQGQSPLTLDVQNATWSAKQAGQLPLTDADESIFSWYLSLLEKKYNPLLGLVVPVLVGDHIILDCIDRINVNDKRLRTNVSGWFLLSPATETTAESLNARRLLKPTKKVMQAACTGHRWQDSYSRAKLRPVMPTLRELLLSCVINWQNFKQPLVI